MDIASYYKHQHGFVNLESDDFLTVTFNSERCNFFGFLMEFLLQMKEKCEARPYSMFPYVFVMNTGPIVQKNYVAIKNYSFNG